MAKLSAMNIAVLVISAISFILLTVGIFHPHWFEPIDLDQSETLPLFGPIWCYNDVCYSFYDKSKTFFDEPGWLMAGRIIGCFSLWSLVAGVITYCLKFNKDTQLLHVMGTTLLITSSLSSFITGFIFVDKFRHITASFQVHKDPMSLTYRTLPVGLIMFASVATAIASIFSALTRRLSGYNFKKAFKMSSLK